MNAHDFSLSLRALFSFSILLNFCPSVSHARRGGESAPLPATCQMQKQYQRQGEEFWQQGQYLMATLFWAQVKAMKNPDCPEDLSDKGQYSLAKGLEKLGESGLAFAQFHELAISPDTAPLIKRKAQLHKALLEPTLAAKTIEVPEDKLRWSLWEHKDSPAEFTRHLQSAEGLLPPPQVQELKELGVQWQQAGEGKDPLVAAILGALVPGAGHAYLGSYQSAVLSLVLNSLFLASTLEFHRKDMMAPALTSGLVFSVTYVGNILSAYKGANIQRQQRQRPVEEGLKKVLFEFTF